MRNKEELKRLADMMYISADIAHGYAVEVKQAMKDVTMYYHQDKRRIDNILNLSRQLVWSVDKQLNNDEKSDNFGSDSDFIREVLEIALQTKSDEDHIRLLSAMKLSIKKVAK